MRERWPIHMRHGIERSASAADHPVMMSLTTRATPERLYRLLADNATDVITLLDAEGRHLYVSPSVTALAGYEPDELVGADGWSLMHPDDLEHLQARLQTAAAEGRVVTLE